MKKLFAVTTDTESFEGKFIIKTKLIFGYDKLAELIKTTRQKHDLKRIDGYDSEHKLKEHFDTIGSSSLRLRFDDTIMYVQAVSEPECDQFAVEIKEHATGKAYCPCCDAPLEYHQQGSTHIYSCPECPIICFEFSDNSNTAQLNEYLQFTQNQ